MTQLNAWTKVGDSALSTGCWVLYQHKARLMSDVEKIAEWTAEEAETATRAYAARAEKLHRGGLWLVGPNGKVAACIWIPTRNAHGT